MPDNRFTFSARAPAAPNCFTACRTTHGHLCAVRFEPAPEGGTTGVACDGGVLAVWRAVRSEGPDRAVMRQFPRCGIRRMALRDAGRVRISRLHAGDVQGRSARQCRVFRSVPGAVALPTPVHGRVRHPMRRGARGRVGERSAQRLAVDGRHPAPQPGRPALGKPQHRTPQAPGVRRI